MQNSDLNLQINQISYPIMESFYTIQGEGVNSGRAAYFIRLGGCNVGCVWCDVKDSWDSKLHPTKSIDELLFEAQKFPSRLIVITGGEPAMYDLKPLTTAFINNGFELAIETSGAYPISGTWNHICVSPKKFMKPLVESLNIANELKVIIYNKSDFDWAEKNAQNLNENCTLLLQPEYSKFDQMIPLIVEYVKENTKWRITLQTHKIIQVP